MTLDIYKKLVNEFIEAGHHWSAELRPQLGETVQIWRLLTSQTAIYKGLNAWEIQDKLGSKQLITGDYYWRKN